MFTKYEYLPREILKSQELTPAQKLIYLHFFHIAGWQDNTLNITHLSEKLNISKRTIYSHLPHLEELNLIKVNSDKSVSVYLNGIEIKDRDFFKNSLNRDMLGNFAKAPVQFIYDTNLSPVERIALMMIFDFNFEIDEKGYFKQKYKTVNIKSAATYYNTSYDALKKAMQRAKKIGAVEYGVYTSNGKSSIYGLIFNKAVMIPAYIGKDGEIKPVVKNIKSVEEQETIEEIVEEEQIEATPEQKAEIEKLEATLKSVFKIQYETSVKDKYEPEYTINWLRKRSKIA